MPRQRQRAGMRGARVVAVVEFEQDDGDGEHHHRNKNGGDRGRQNRLLAIDRTQDRQRDKAGISHRRGHAIQSLTAQVPHTLYACDDEHREKARQRPSAESNQKGPVDQRPARLLRNGDNKQRRHGNVVGEMHQCIRQRARQVAGPADDPAGHDDGEDRQNEISDLQRLVPRVPGWARARRMRFAVRAVHYHRPVACTSRRQKPDVSTTDGE